MGRRLFVGSTAFLVLWSGAAREAVTYSGDGSDLQQVVDRAAAGSVVECDVRNQRTLTAPLLIRKPLTLRGLNARLPEKLARTSLIVVEAEGVTLEGLELHGNYDSVSQKDRAPLIKIHAGNFRLERCRFYDSTKDGVEITPKPNGGDIVGGIVRDIKGFRIGRDAVSISGGNRGEKVRDVVVENVSLRKGYHRGAVEVSDGTDNIRVRDVYAEDCTYAIDVQDHGRESAANTNVLVENVEAVRCRHIIRTANSPRAHANLTLKSLTGRDCRAPVRISHTANVLIDGLKILRHADGKEPPIDFKGCTGVTVTNARIQTAAFVDNPIRSRKTTGLIVEGLVTERPLVPAVLGYGAGVFRIGKLLAEDDFDDLGNWVVQQQTPDADPEQGPYARAVDGVLDVNSPGRGTTVWFRRKLRGPIAVVYRVKCPTVPDPTKRYCPRDINCFWHCTDPDHPDDVLVYGKGGKYNGNFGSYHGMHGYYASTGGGANTTTRFRRYPRGKDKDGKAIPHIALTERDGQPDFLIVPDKWHAVQLVAFNDIIQYVVHGRVVYQIRYGDEVTTVGGTTEKRMCTKETFPGYSEGYVGFRMTCTRQQFRDFVVYRLQPAGK